MSILGALDGGGVIVFSRTPDRRRRPALNRTTTAKSRKHTPFPRVWTTRESGPSTRGSRTAGGRSTPPLRTCRHSRPSSSWRAPRVSSPRWSPPTPCTTPCRSVPCISPLIRLTFCRYASCLLA